MRDYGKVGPKFWIGATGKKLRAAGPEAQIVALYLMTSPHANMLGLYYVPQMFIAHETGLGLEGAAKGLVRAVEAGFCEYDEASEMVWVIEMAKYQIADALTGKDLRIKGVQNEYDTLPANPFLARFFEHYAHAFCMTKQRGADASLSPALQAPLKPLASQEQEQEQEQEQKQEQEQEKEHATVPAAAAVASKSARKPAKTPLPSDFAISAAVRTWAEANGHMNLQAHFDSFVGKARANGYTYADWDQALQNAIREDWAKLGTQQRTPPAHQARPSRHSNFENINYHEGIQNGRIT